MTERIDQDKQMNGITDLTLANFDGWSTSNNNIKCDDIPLTISDEISSRERKYSQQTSAGFGAAKILKICLDSRSQYST